MDKQAVFRGESGYSQLERYIIEKNSRGVFIVCGKSFQGLRTGEFFRSFEQRTGIKTVYFTGFTPNPTYEEAAAGVAAFRASGCDIIIGAGGGSAMDTAKCVKLFAEMPDDKPYVEQETVPNHIPLIAIPTTAGTGSEATKYAVIYYKGEKFSVTDDSAVPEAVLLDGALLKGLPDYHRKSAMLDALCHGIESFWSVNSTAESRELSAKAIQMILGYRIRYIGGNTAAEEVMLEAAYIAGQAINITATTAGHAMSYKLTSLYGMAHGHAAALCAAADYRFMLENLQKCSDPRGAGSVEKILTSLVHVFHSSDTGALADFLAGLPETLGLRLPEAASTADIPLLVSSVNAGRLKNNPVQPDSSDLARMYTEILGGKNES